MDKRPRMTRIELVALSFLTAADISACLGFWPLIGG